MEITFNEIGEMVNTADVKGLFRIFNLAENWDTRETAVVALQRILIDKIEYDKADMVEALKNIIQLCKAEWKGGTYRTNCLETAQSLLKQIERKK